MATQSFDFERIAAEFLRALRGGRTQGGFARRLGYRSNIVHSWEACRAFPTAAKTLWIAERGGVNVSAALLTMYRKPPGWLEQMNPTTREGVAQFLRDLQGNTNYKELASRTGKNRFKIARWFKGEAEPRLPDFFRLIEATTLRLLDFLAALVEPDVLPSVQAQWRELDNARQATYRQPWSQAVLRVLETKRYSELPAHTDDALGRWLGISSEEVAQSLELLMLTGQVAREAGKYVPVADSPTIDTRRDPDAAHGLREFWFSVALERLKAREEGLFAHNLVGVSEKDLQAIRELQKAHYQQVRSIVARSEPVERVALVTMQILPLA